MKFEDKYSHLGYTYLGISKHWQPAVKRALIEMEKEMWVPWLPLFVKRWVHYLATGGSVVRIKYWWAYRLRNKLTYGGQIIHDIKDKYAGLRIYASANATVHSIIDRVTKECDGICEQCGSLHNVSVFEHHGWDYNLCEECRIKNHNDENSEN